MSLLDSIEKVNVTEEGLTEDNILHLNEILRRASETLSELKDLIQTKIILNFSPTQPLKISRTQWLRRSTQVRSLVEKVRKARLDLSALLTVLQA